jgi:hypothetical protein
MFALPLFGLRNAAERPATWLRIAAFSGFLVTLLYCVLSVFPIIEVQSWFWFAAKITGVVVGANVLGVLLYFAGSRKGPELD